jgi:hypothetical protein
MKNFLLISALIIVSALLVHQCRVTTQLSQTNKKNQLASLDSINYYKNKLGLEVAEKQTFVGTSKQLKIYLEAAKQKNKQLRNTIAAFRKLAAASSVEQTIKIDSVDIPFQEKVSVNFVRKFLKQTEYYTFSGEVNEFGINVNFLSTNLQTQATGIKNVGWFNSEFRTEVTNNNPYITTSNFQNFTFIERKKRFGIGVSFGFGLYQKGFFIGPSVNYNLIQF